MHFLFRFWPHIGGVIGAILVIVLFSRSGPMLGSVQWLLWLMLPAFMLHHVEAFVWPGGFREQLNALFAPPAGPGEEAAGGLSLADVFFINAVLVWGGVVLAAALYPLSYIPAALVLGATVVNGLVYLGLALAKRRYTPAMATGAVLLLPLSIYILTLLVAQTELTLAGTLPYFLFGLLVHAAIAGYSLFKVKRKPASRP